MVLSQLNFYEIFYNTTGEYWNFLVMEYFEGPSFYDYAYLFPNMERRTLFLYSFAHPMIQKLLYAHQHNITHRDVKLGHFIFRKYPNTFNISELIKEEFVLIDWGCANYDDMGTVRYYGRPGPLGDYQALLFSIADILGFNFPLEIDSFSKQNYQLIHKANFSKEALELPVSDSIRRNISQAFVVIGKENWTVYDLLDLFPVR